MKGAVEARNSVCHSATVFANAAAHCGTSVDAFLRDNLDWLSRATNWAKFGATAGLGVIHKGQLAQSRSLMVRALLVGGLPCCRADPLWWCCQQVGGKGAASHGQRHQRAGSLTNASKRSNN